MAYSKRIVVTGIGPLSSIGIGKESLWQSMLKGETGLVREDFEMGNEKIDSCFIHKITDFDINNFGIEKAFLQDIETWKQEKNWIDLSYLMASAKLAIDDSKLRYDRDNNTIGLVLSHENPGLDQFYASIFDELSQKTVTGAKPVKERFQEFYKKFGTQAYDLQTFMFLYHVAKTLGLHGFSLFLNNACASGLYAIEAASDIIKSGKCEIAVVAASDKASIFKTLWFKELGMYPDDGKTKPFAKGRNGFVLGDGGAGMVLETLDSAKKRKAPIYAEYLGGGFTLEGWKVAVPNLISNAYKDAILKAMQRSKIKKGQIDLIVPHGVGTVVTDLYEAKAIVDIFGKDFKKPFLTAFKPYIGHNLGSTALLETTILLLSLQKNVIPPTLNCQEPDPKLHILPVREQVAANLKTVMKTACGFAGYNGAVVFRKLTDEK